MSAFERAAPSPRAALAVIGAFAALALVSPDSARAGAMSANDVAMDPPDLSRHLALDDARAFRRSLANMKPMTLNQQAYDVRGYDLDLHPDPVTQVLTGTARTRATVTSGPLTTIDLDLDDAHMTVDGATSAGSPVTFVQGGGLLTVQLDRAYVTGETFEVAVQYHGTPGSGAYGGAFVFTTRRGLPLITSISEPFDARTWWPCKDDPSDKADSVDVRVTVPSGMITAGNGRLVESVDDATTAFTHWHERHPIATYLVSIASYPYAVITDWYHASAVDSMELRFHLFPEDAAAVAPVDATVKDMLAAFAARFGPYPFQDEKYGHAQFLFGGGMENQTCTSLGSFGSFTIAHELAHQWWGDAITCRDFHHVWLNEGFATFSEALWAETNGGTAAYHDYMNALAYLGPGTVYVPDVDDAARIFNYQLSYEKGAWVLHMLRRVMGDTTFFAGLRGYLQAHAYGTAVTEDLESACEAASGRDLTAFFQQWIYGEGHPDYGVGSSWQASRGGGYDVTVQVRQAQAGPVFRMPVDVRVATDLGPFDFVAQDSTALQSFVFHVPGAPAEVSLDPDQWLLRTVAVDSTLGQVPPPRPGLELATPLPNPSRGPATFEFTIPSAGSVDLSVLDLAGRRLARLQNGLLPAGPHRVQWSGRDAADRRLEPGVYWVSLEFHGERRSRRLAIVD